MVSIENSVCVCREKLKKNIMLALHFPTNFLGQYPGSAVAGSPTGVVPSSQHQMPVTSQPQPDMYGVQMNGSGMSAEYQTGSNVGANVQSQVSYSESWLSPEVEPYGL